MSAKCNLKSPLDSNIYLVQWLPLEEKNLMVKGDILNFFESFGWYLISKFRFRIDFRLVWSKVKVKLLLYL